MRRLLQVEVFPVARDRWMAVIDAPSGSFSTEASAPEGVPARVAEAIQEVLGDGVADILLVDDLGTTWTVAGSEEQLRRLAV